MQKLVEIITIETPLYSTATFVIRHPTIRVIVDKLNAIHAKNANLHVNTDLGSIPNNVAT